MKATLVVAAVLLPAALIAQQDTTRLRWVPNPQTANGSWVADPAKHLRPETVARIDSIAGALKRETTAEIAVAVIDSLDNLDPSSAAFTLHRRWGVGERARDNGMVLLWSPRLRQIHVSVGYGLEGVIPDAVAGRVQDSVMIPHFRRDEFDAGMIAGVSALAAAARGETYAGRPAESTPSEARNVFVVVGSVLGGVGVLLLGLVGFANRPRRCPKGHGFMRKLSEERDNAALSKEQVLEENLGAMNYHVYVCDTCTESLIIPRVRWSSYQKCPKCRRRTMKRDLKTLVKATYDKAGQGEVTKECKNCGWKDVTLVSLPKLERSSGGSGGGRGGGFGGGGGGGGFGGGSTGGGGAGRSY
jgi:uncharacterized protein